MPESSVRVSAVKIGASRQVVIPKRAFVALGLAPGDYFEVSVQRGSLVLTPKTLVDKAPENGGAGSSRD